MRSLQLLQVHVNLTRNVGCGPLLAYWLEQLQSYLGHGNGHGIIAFKAIKTESKHCQPDLMTHLTYLSTHPTSHYSQCFLNLQLLSNEMQQSLMVVIYHQLCHSHPILRVIGILDIWRWGRFSGKLNMLPVSRAIVLGCCLIHQMTKWLRESQDCNNTPLRMKYILR